MTNRFRNLLFLIFSIYSDTIFSTVFVPVPIKDQIIESSAIVMAHYLDKKSEKMDDGQIVTSLVFSLQKETGLSAKEWGFDEILVYVPGGQVGDFVTKVEGVPEFVSGEKVVLFLREQDGRFWLQNLGLGAYGVVKVGDELVLNNRVFPSNVDMGSIKLGKFEELVDRYKGQKLTQVLRDESKFFTGNSRSIASIKNKEENSTSKTQPHVLWLVFLLAVLGCGWMVYKKRSY
jgi:hypothetical protein